MTQLNQQTLDILKQQFLGKKLSVKTKKGNFVGNCTFIGYNEYIPSFGLQLTLDRTPITNVEIKDIKLVE
jgi:hypothetical protein